MLDHICSGASGAILLTLTVIQYAVECKIECHSLQEYQQSEYLLKITTAN